MGRTVRKSEKAGVRHLGGGVSLGNAFLDCLRRAVDEVLRFLQAKAGQLADHLDDLNLLGAGARQDHVELGLLLDLGSSSGTTTSASRDRNRCGADAPLGFQFLDEVGDVHHWHCREIIDDLFFSNFSHLLAP